MALAATACIPVNEINRKMNKYVKDQERQKIEKRSEKNTIKWIRK